MKRNWKSYLRPGGGYKERSVQPLTVYQITLDYACGGIMLRPSGEVIITAPIFRWMKRYTLSQIEEWVTSKGGTIARVRGTTT